MKPDTRTTNPRSGSTRGAGPRAGRPGRSRSGDEQEHVRAFPSGPDQPSAEKIAAQAYGLYERRGRQDGHDIDDWLEAEQMLRAQQQPASRETGRSH